MTLPARAPSHFRRDIQGLRALAVLLVVVYHTGFGLPGGFIGVDVFFVISGYVITRMLLAELEETGAIAFGRFYSRRVRRLLPALGVMLSVVMVLGVFLSPVGVQRLMSRTGISAALFNANTYLARESVGYFDPALELNALLHTWSLSVEEQFYFFFPALLFIIWQVQRLMGLGRGRLAATLALILVFTVSLYASVRLSYIDPTTESWAFYLAPTRAWEFVAGGLLVFVAPHVQRLPRPVGLAAAVSGLGMVLASALAFDSSTVFPGTAALLPVAGTALLIVAGEGRSNPISGLLSTSGCQWLGDRSYSLYLWHWPAIVFAAALMPQVRYAPIYGAMFSLVPSVLSYRYVEQRLRSPQPASSHGDLRVGRSLRLAAAAICLPLVASVALVTSDVLLRRTDVLEPFAPHAGQFDGCDSEIALGDRTEVPCTWSGPDPVGQVVLVGDSQAGHLAEGLIEAARSINVSATLASMSACPFADLTIIDDGEAKEDCRQFVMETTADLVASAPDLVVLASASDSYIDGDNTVFRSPSGEEATTEEGRAEEWTEALGRTIDTLRAEDIEVVVVHPTPKFDEWDPRSCAAVLLVVAPDRCSASEATESLDSDRQPALIAERRAVSTSGAVGVDFFDEICNRSPCSAKSGDAWLWRDAGHISVEQSRRLAPQMAAVLQAALD